MATRINYENNLNENVDIGDILYSSKYVNDFFKIRTLEDLKKETKILIDSTEDPDLKTGLQIMLKLISHEKKDVVAYSLGKLYTMIHDEKTRKMILNELNEMKGFRDQSLQNTIDQSMDIIEYEMDSYKVFDLSMDIIHRMVSNMSCNTKKLFEFVQLDLSSITKNGNKFELSMKKFIRSLISNHKLMVHWNDMMYSLMELFIEMDGNMHVLDISCEEIDDYFLNTADTEILPYNELKEIELTNENYLHTLADVYATTFRENGHITHLLKYLDDEDYKVRLVGVRALIYVLKKLTNFEDKSPYKNMISNLFKYKRSILPWHVHSK